MNAQRPVIIAPSILAADWGHLADECQRAADAGADWLHLDVMDGHFVDNISFGPAFVSFVRKASQLPLDVHLMIERPDHFLPRFLEASANVTVHVEAPHDVHKTLAEIWAAGRTCGLALNPATPIESAVPFLAHIDLLLVMTVVPGFGGQKFMRETLPKMQMASDYRANHGLDFHIEVDGGINAETGALCRGAGANALVAGTSFFGVADKAAAVRAMRE